MKVSESLDENAGEIHNSYSPHLTAIQLDGQKVMN